MNESNPRPKPLVKSLLRSNVQVLSLCLFMFALIASACFALVILPTLHKVSLERYEGYLQGKLELELKLFENFVDSQARMLADFARYPSLANTVMLADTNNPEVNDLVQNSVIEGEPAHLVLQDIRGDILLKSDQTMMGRYDSTQPWLKPLLSGEKPYHFKLLAQRQDTLFFQLATPVKYRNSIEGILSAEILLPLNRIFPTNTTDNSAIRLNQGDVEILAQSKAIRAPKEISTRFDAFDLTLTYISDESSFIKKQRDLASTIYTTLAMSLGITFIVFTGSMFWTLRIKHADMMGPQFKRRYAPMVCLLGSIGFGGSVASALLIQDMLKVRYWQQFETQSRSAIQALRADLKGNLQALHATKALFDASDSVSRREFRIFAQRLLLAHPQVQALQWIPQVPASERANYEARARMEGLNDFVFTDKNSRGELIEAVERPIYYPVYYVEPMVNNEIVLGLAPSYSNSRDLAIEQAARSGALAAAEPIRLLQNPNERSGYLIFLPVYQKPHLVRFDSLLSTSVTRQLQGLVLLVLNTSQVLKDFTLRHPDIDIYLEDVASAEPVRLFGTPPAAQITISENITLADRALRISTSPTTAQPLALVPHLVMATGMLLTIIVTLSLLRLLSRRDSLEVLAATQNDELRMLSATIANSNDLFVILEAPTSTSEILHPTPLPKIRYANEAFSRFIQRPNSQIIGQSYEMFLGEQTHKPQLRAMQIAVMQQRAFHCELVVYTAANTPRWIDLSLSPIFAHDGQLLYYALVQRDIADRQLATKRQQQLIDTLSSSNEELTRFAFVCSHDLQEPLRMIRSFSNRLQQHLREPLEQDTKAKQYFGFVIDGANRAQTLIQDILEYSRIDQSTTTLQLIDMNKLLSVIRETALAADNTIGQSEITWDELPTILGNRTQMLQLFQNLVNNGLKYQAQDAIKPVVHLRAKCQDEHWLFEVADNGIGIQHEYCETIFEVFHRLHSKHEYAGTGIGLSICKKIAHRHGGSIWVESNPGSGSTFFIRIPKSDQVPIQTVNFESVG